MVGRNRIINEFLKKEKEKEQDTSLMRRVTITRLRTYGEGWLRALADKQNERKKNGQTQLMTHQSKKGVGSLGDFIDFEHKLKDKET